MLETLVSSRVRRTLYEYLLTYPADRFYLRGLAKALSLSVSPLRRELQRLEHVGVLKAYEEANVRFYVIDQAHPQFVQLKQAVASPTASPSQEPAVFLPSVPFVSSTVFSAPKIERIQRALRPAFPWPAVVGLIGVMVVVGMVVMMMTYLAATNQHLAVLTKEAVSAPRTQVTVVKAEPRASGEMHSTRWRLVPGAVGGFSPAASDSTREESY